MTAKTYLVANSSMPTTAAPVKQPTGTAIRTMMQLLANAPIRIVEWGCSFDASAAAVPGQVELVDTGTVGATALSTYYAVADIMPQNDPNAPANGSGTTGTPFGISTSGAYSGFSTAAVTEGSITACREFDPQLVAPTSQYVKQFPLGREPEIPVGHFLRIRMTFGTSVNAYCYVVVETF